MGKLGFLNARVLLGGLLATLLPVAAGTADKPIRVAVLNDLSSVYSDYQGEGSIVAAGLAADEMGKVAGGPIEVVFGDHQNKADVGVSLALKWLDTEGVDAILDVPNSAIALAVADIVRQRNKVLLASGAGTAELTGAKCSANIVQWTYDTWAASRSAARAMVERGGKRWFFITADYTF